MNELTTINTEKKILLDAVVKTRLPILITGNRGAGKTTIAEYLRTTYNKTVHDDNGETPYDDEEVYVTTDRFINRYRKRIKEYIEVKCYYIPEQRAHYTQILLHKKDVKYTTDKLIPTLPFVIIKGKNAKDYADRLEGIETININDKSEIRGISEIVEGRISYVELTNKENYTQANLKQLHLTCNLEDLTEYLMRKGFIRILDNLEKVGVMVTAYTEDDESVSTLYAFASAVVDV